MNTGDRGLTLSGGQQQRLSLARAVYADADLYLMVGLRHTTSLFACLLACLLDVAGLRGRSWLTVLCRIVGGGGQDDVLSAVDAHVGAEIWRRCIVGVLADRAKLLVLHNTRYVTQWHARRRWRPYLPPCFVALSQVCSHA